MNDSARKAQRDKIALEIWEKLVVPAKQKRATQSQSRPDIDSVIQQFASVSLGRKRRASDGKNTNATTTKKIHAERVVAKPKRTRSTGSSQDSTNKKTKK